MCLSASLLAKYLYLARGGAREKPRAVHSCLRRIPYFFQASIFFNFSDFEPKFILRYS